MKKVIFSLTVLLCFVSAITAKAQVSVAVKVGAPVYCPPPVRVIVVAPPPPRVVVVKPAPVVVVRPRPVVVIPPHPVYVVARPARRIVIYR